MDIGKYYQANQQRLEVVSEQEWTNALAKCKKHLKLRIKQKTLYGAHTEENLGDDPYDYYTSFAYEAILSGRWEWKDGFSLSKQMIRIIDSRISEEVEKVKREKSEALKIKYTDSEDGLYKIDVLAYDSTQEEAEEWEKQIQTVENAITNHDDLLFFWDCIKEGHKRADIAGLMELELRQLDKVRERFIRTIRKYHAQAQKTPTS